MRGFVRRTGDDIRAIRLNLPDDLRRATFANIRRAPAQTLRPLCWPAVGALLMIGSAFAALYLIVLVLRLVS